LLTLARIFVLNRGGTAQTIAHNGAGQMQASAKKVFDFVAQWDREAGVWWCSNDELPVTTEAPTFEELVARIAEIAPEMAEANGIAPPGEKIEIRVVAERVQSVPVPAAA
jgi:uncharacterized protein DUF1902